MRRFSAETVARLRSFNLLVTSSQKGHSTGLISSGLSTKARRYFGESSASLKKQDFTVQDEIQKDKQRVRSSAGKTSLRRVSIEAERSRLIINRAGRKFTDPNAETKVCQWLVVRWVYVLKLV
jgi:hypothetical protein